MCIFKQFGKNSDYWAKWNSIGYGFELSGIGQNVTNHAEISHAESLFTDSQVWLVSDVLIAPNSDNGRLSPGHAGHQTLQAFQIDIGPLIQQRLAEFMEVDRTPQFVPQMLDRVAGRAVWRLVHFSDVIFVQIISL